MSPRYSPADLGSLGLDPARMPSHVAIIMDGNGRWARKRFLPRVAGHRAGVNSVREAVRTCGELGISYLTLYAFSTENWKRPAEEVSALWSLLVEYLRKEVEELNENDVRLRAIGRISDLPRAAQDELDRAIARLDGNKGLTLVLSLNYGGRAEIVDAARALVRDGVAVEDIDDGALAARMYTALIPDPELLIRTSGEMRLSNFLLWQLAYSEIVVLDKLWPDFRKDDLVGAVKQFQSRDRRFGGV